MKYTGAFVIFLATCVAANPVINAARAEESVNAAASNGEKV